MHEKQLQSVLCFTPLHNPLKKGGVLWKWEFQTGLVQWILNIPLQKSQFLHAFHANGLLLRSASLPQITRESIRGQLALNGPS